MSDTAAPSILLVEDNPNDAELTLRALEKHQLADEVLVITDGAAALDYLFGTGEYADRAVTEQPKVVVLDLKLPKIDGHDLLKRLRGDARTRRIPVVVLTSSAVDRDVVESYRLGANSYIVKPVEFDRFVAAVSEIGTYWLKLNWSPG